MSEISKGDLYKPTLAINLEAGIPQIGDSTWMTLPSGERINCIILSIEEVVYDGRLNLNITYNTKVLDVTMERNTRDHLKVID